MKEFIEKAKSMLGHDFGPFEGRSKSPQQIAVATCKKCGASVGVNKYGMFGPATIRVCRGEKC